ncbi:MAG: hypothetical protein A2Z15_09225 [Chloroflexi bacterium RBG_16_50_11]|nr:MAG: hypothetical protein A2Z15_09225 [Chloroflexi bacterium RBG_16_50_11]
MKITGNIKPVLRKLAGGIKKPFAKVANSGLNEPLVRLLVGILGVALPIVVVVWGLGITGWPPQDSISDYYSLRTRDAFVGILFVIGWILFAYKGYRTLDSVAGKLVCLFAMGVAFFPNTGLVWEKALHFTSATCMFLILGFFSLYLFTKNEQTEEAKLKKILATNPYKANKTTAPISEQKKTRNRVYIFCGSAIFACILLLAIYLVFLQDTVIANAHPMLILETLMIWFFGFAWFVKGKGLWRDKPTTKSNTEQPAVNQ